MDSDNLLQLYHKASKSKSINENCSQVLIFLKIVHAINVKKANNLLRFEICCVSCLTPCYKYDHVTTEKPAPLHCDGQRNPDYMFILPSIQMEIVFIASFLEIRCMVLLSIKNNLINYYPLHSNKIKAGRKEEIYIENTFKIRYYCNEKKKLKHTKHSKVGDRCQGRPEGSLFNSYYTEV